MTAFEWVQILTSFTAALGFSLIFGLHGRQLPVAAVGSALTWLVCLAGGHSGMDSHWCVFIASLFGSVYSAAAAKLLKMPKTVFLFAVLISLIPGSGLYQTMRFAVDGELEQFLLCGIDTLLTSFAIAFGMIVVLAADAAIRRFSKRTDTSRRTKT